MSSSTDKLKECFVKALGISENVVKDDLTYNTIPEWDSVGHMAMIAAIESEFNIMMDINDIIAMSTFGKAKSILTKYGINFN